jgi:flagellar hook-associated protein 3 FlgL
MQITFNTSFEDGIRAISRASEALAEAQRQVASGRKLNQPSDDPLGAAAAVAEHANLTRLDAYSGAADAASSRLGLADAVLSDVINQLTAAQGTALGARGSSVTQAQRDAAANQILSMRDALLSDVNTQIQGVYLFSGSKSNVAPYATAGSGFTGYRGDSAVQTIDIGTSRSVSITLDGGQIFQGSDATHVLDAMTSLAAAISAGNDAGISAGVDALKRAFDRATTAQAAVGNGLRALDDNQAELTAIRTQATSRIANIENADLAESASRMTEAQTAYRAALAAMANTGQMSLMDYLK